MYVKAPSNLLDRTPNMTPFELPQAPTNQTDAVKAWRAPVAIPTYHPLPPDKNPMFLEKRVYQGSSGRVYPLPFTDRISTEPRTRSWQAVHIENEFVRVMVLPEIGGRIHVGMDKANGYDFFYRQNVIKPALVGLAGPWISGGVELNWPQHHRPATFMPVECEIEEHSDGSRTIWCSDHDPMNRLKGMHGVCLHPGKSYIELKVRLYNRTPFVQTFLWWANVGTHVHELYQSFFPTDVHWVADHARRAMSKFPLCDGYYYGVNYGGRAIVGVPDEERPPKFVPPGIYPANDLSWYANIPVPTSYMAMNSREDFHGGYDHRRNAGLVLVADHHIAPGKKQWTWGNHPFGYAWDRNLTDEDGPYIELMAGVYTDNQPDFSFLAPGETKTFSQYWYPIREIGVPQKANVDAAVSLRTSGHTAHVGVCVTKLLPGARVRLKVRGKKIAEWDRDLEPGKPFIESVDLLTHITAADLSAVIAARDGTEILHYAPKPVPEQVAPPAATEPSQPEEVSSNDELFVIGLHLEQYRHATRYPEPYWREAVRRDPGDSRCNNALGLWHLRRGEFQKAEQHFRVAIDRLTSRNANPYDSEPYYNLGLTLRQLGRDEEAYSAFYKSTWSHAWQSAAYLALAELDVKRRDWMTALNHLRDSLRMNTDHLNARNLMAIVLRRIGRDREADEVLKETRALDPMDSWARYLESNSLPHDNQMIFDLALDHARSGLYSEAIEILTRADKQAQDGSLPTMSYALAYFQSVTGNSSAAGGSYSEAAKVTPDYCFPSRIEELLVLEAAMASNPADARAPYYLGNLLYDRRRHREAIELWERSSHLDATLSVVWRNLGIGYFNVLGDSEKARAAFDKAIAVNPDDARIFYERDQLWKRIGEAPEKRLKEFERFDDLVHRRDDLSVELAALYNHTGQHEKALSVIQLRKFQPWEGGEGLVLGQHVRTHLALGRRELAGGNPTEARRLFEAALQSPENLGEATHLLANRSDIFYLLGVAADAAGDRVFARECFERAAKHKGDFQEMSVKLFSEMTYYNALALKRLGRTAEADILLRELLLYAKALPEFPGNIDYFATSLPAMLLFEEDLKLRNKVTATFLQAQAHLGLGDPATARNLLGQVLQLDRNHALAADLLNEFEATPAAG
jgi:tetratricopeptide (TPR) repeat protein